MGVDLDQAQFPVASRISGFLAHLRAHHIQLGIEETRDAVFICRQLGVTQLDALRRALKIRLCGCRKDWRRFDDYFAAYWFGRSKIRPAKMQRQRDLRPQIWRRRLTQNDHRQEGQIGAAQNSDAANSADRADRDGANDHDIAQFPIYTNLAASPFDHTAQMDLRNLLSPEAIALAEETAFLWARKIALRMVRRYQLANKHGLIDLRASIRENISKGGELICLRRKTRPKKPVRLLVFLDVSGSMKPYVGFLLHFVKGVVRHWPEARVFLFHARLVETTDIMRATEPRLVMDKLSLLRAGFGGGTRLGQSLQYFNDFYAQGLAARKTVCMIISDGYDSDAPGVLGGELVRLRKKVAKIFWLNPMLGWRDYAPVTRAMAEALKHIDGFYPAHSLAALADGLTKAGAIHH